MGLSTVTWSLPQTISFPPSSPKPASSLFTEPRLCCSLHPDNRGPSHLSVPSEWSHCLLFFFHSAGLAQQTPAHRHFAGYLKRPGDPTTVLAFSHLSLTISTRSTPFGLRIHSLAVVTTCIPPPPTRRRSSRDQPPSSFAHRITHLTSRRRHAAAQRPSRRQRQFYPTDSILYSRRYRAPRPFIWCTR